MRALNFQSDHSIPILFEKYNIAPFDVTILSSEQRVVSRIEVGKSAKRRRLIAKLCSRIVMKIGARVTPVIVGVTYSAQCLGFDISIRSSLHGPSF